MEKIKFVSLLFIISVFNFSFAYANDLIKSLTNGECSTHACMNIYNIRSLTNDECSTQNCFTQHTNKSLGLAKNYPVSSVYSGSNDYDVSGYGDGGYVTGNIDASGDGYVNGYITLDDGTEVSFDGEWTGNGEIEGHDENGNYYELEVD